MENGCGQLQGLLKCCHICECHCRWPAWSSGFGGAIGVQRWRCRVFLNYIFSTQFSDLRCFAHDILLVDPHGGLSFNTVMRPRCAGASLMHGSRRRGILGFPEPVLLKRIGIKTIFFFEVPLLIQCIHAATSIWFLDCRWVDFAPKVGRLEGIGIRMLLLCKTF